MSVVKWYHAGFQVLALGVQIPPLMPKKVNIMRANYRIINQNEQSIVIQDVGDHTKVPTVTNDISAVVEDLHKKDLLGDRILTYYDSNNNSSRVRHNNGVFIGFIG